MGDAFDLDAVETLASDGPWVFKFGGETFEFPPDPEAQIISKVRVGDFDGALHDLLGDEQYEAMGDLEGATMTVGKLSKLLEAYMGSILAEPAKDSATGKSSGPSRSSRTTKRK